MGQAEEAGRFRDGDGVENLSGNGIWFHEPSQSAIIGKGFKVDLVRLIKEGAPMFPLWSEVPPFTRSSVQTG